jgi:hypothetical protein
MSDNTPANPVTGMSETDYASMILGAIENFQNNSARSVQSNEGKLGPSDIGFCRQKASLMVKGVNKTDKTPMQAAAIGTALHNYYEEAIKASYPNWLLGSIDDLRVTAVLPSGAEISGHPDIVIPESNTVLDIKTVDGFGWVRREGTSSQHKFQRHLYAMGCIKSGLFDESKPVMVGNIYFDRSGKEKIPYLAIEEFDPTVTDEIDAWIGDVIYAVKNDEDAMRDVPAAVCERICEFFTVCRGGLEENDGVEKIEDLELLSAVDMYVKGRELSKEADEMKKAAQNMLIGVSGFTNSHQVRWVTVNPTMVNSFQKNGYQRMDVRKVRK